MKLSLDLATKRIARTPREAFSIAAQSRRPAYVCLQCRYEAFGTAFRGARVGILDKRREFSSVSRWMLEEKGKGEAVTPRTTAYIEGQMEDKPPATNGSVRIAPEENLPSHRENLRWRISKRLNQLMDDLMPKLALASQRINNYTGTDYSGIEALRKEIIEQEKLVKTHHASVQTAKETYELARSSEIKSRKEVVALLERRHSWTDTDLERYMSLIRSEHLNDQAVQTAKDALNTAEKALEEVRGRLEKRERMQYHEEQIWSDTIRRNSTWVTFGLMGVNIALLLVTMVGIEPWRRKRMVREIKDALEEQRLGQEMLVTQRDAGRAAEANIAPSEVVDEGHTMPIAVPNSQELESTTEIPPEKLDLPELIVMAEDISALESLKLSISDLFSERAITLRKIDISTIALESAAAGATAMALLILLLRPR